MVSFVIPSYNNLRHLKNCYESIKKHEQSCEIILIDDGSTDGTYNWMMSIKDSKVKVIRSEERLGHTIQYDVGISQSSNEIVAILHADMILGPNYLNNVVKHLKEKTVVCATRVEPPLHPQGKEKIVQDFGTDFDNLRVNEFEAFCLRSQNANKDLITKGMFAPWIIRKEDFLRIGGHDPLFAPFPYEDSDIFQRWILAGYNLIQSRDAFVYHLTCRGHRWTDQIGVDDTYYKNAAYRAGRNYIRKWGSWIENNEYQYPIINPKYDIGLVVSGRVSKEAIVALEPWFNTIYVNEECKIIIDQYVKEEQVNTSYDVSNRIKTLPCKIDNDIIVEINVDAISNSMMSLVSKLPKILQTAEEGAYYELEELRVKVNRLSNRTDDLIFINKHQYTI